ncbi:hypothetical protein FA09DRAFT_328286 [Tilletiopsis washingtonensis]|uniref:Uncharacterized protein n=1 Tax=Tilletiopsis washingtonensis TaxID=58919 RepID=A0A316ZF83_9BASI|nr:hypothetical protein FA09DRAFT_328286 [Tilletiopsis washingtonensis]PWO00182.1 hypothetical protein FA09DRAFT_328286 [Tilletiopsis washingtonensis]
MGCPISAAEARRRSAAVFALPVPRAVSPRTPLSAPPAVQRMDGRCELLQRTGAPMLRLDRSCRAAGSSCAPACSSPRNMQPRRRHGALEAQLALAPRC